MFEPVVAWINDSLLALISKPKPFVAWAKYPNAKLYGFKASD